MMIRSVAMAGMLVGGWSVQAGADDPLRLNQIQVVGTHNSYHIAPHPNVLRLLDQKAPGLSEGLDYTHRPFAEQFGRLGIRQVELDVFADSQGGRYAQPAARSILQGEKLDPGADPALQGELQTPGFKVFHVQDIDYLSRASTFAAALRRIRDWSVAHPRHVPILILVETKQEPIPRLPTRPEPFGATELAEIDAAILAAFGRDRVITPDDVRGESETLPAALRTRGWPLLDDSRGKILVTLNDTGALRDVYLADHPALQDRVMFVSVAPDHPAAAWMKVEDPVADFARIQELVRAGFLVRTRADADTVDARRNDPARRDKAFASGAQFISTDYPEPDLRFSPYQVRLPGEVVARGNPLIGPQGVIDLETATKPNGPKE